jgi:hypothetical protein
VIPLIDTLTTALVDGVKFGRAIFNQLVGFVGFFIGLRCDRHARQQLLRLLVGQLTENSHRVLPFNFISRVHQSIRELTARGENQ